MVFDILFGEILRFEELSRGSWILDLTAWVGDRAMASLNLMGDAHSRCGILRHVIVDPGYKRLGEGASLSHLRASNEVVRQWMNRARILYGEGHALDPHHLRQG